MDGLELRYGEVWRGGMGGGVEGGQHAM